MLFWLLTGNKKTGSVVSGSSGKASSPVVPTASDNNSIPNQNIAVKNQSMAVGAFSGINVLMSLKRNNRILLLRDGAHVDPQTIQKRYRRIMLVPIKERPTGHLRYLTTV